MTCTLPKDEPSLTSRKLKPPFESRRVRTQPCSCTARPTASALRASATVILSMRVSPLGRSEPATRLRQLFEMVLSECTEIQPRIAEKLIVLERYSLVVEGVTDPHQ